MNYYILALKKYAIFKGRATREEYWYFALFSFLIRMLLMVIGNLSEMEQLINLYDLAVLIPSFSVAIRRMHDVGKSGWFILIPIYNIILACRKGDENANKFG